VAIELHLHSTCQESFPRDSEQVISNPVKGTKQQNHGDSYPQFLYIPLKQPLLEESVGH
jgi:hypothetical protein